MTISASALQWLPQARYARNCAIANPLNHIPSGASSTVTREARTADSHAYDTGNMASASLDGWTTITIFPNDGMNRLVAASKSGQSASYEYDADDRRAMKAVTQSGTTTTRALWSGTDELADYDGSGTLLRRVIPGPGIDDKVATMTASGTVSYFHTDRLGSMAPCGGDR